MLSKVDYNKKIDNERTFYMAYGYKTEYVPKYPVQTLGKALDIIEFLKSNTCAEGMSISEISRGLSMAKSGVHRLLDTLMAYGYVEKVENALTTYRLGWGLYDAGSAVPKQHTLNGANYLPLLGKLFLCDFDQASLENYFESAPIQKLTANTITTVAEMKRELKSIKDSGCAMDYEEFFDGMICCAMPIKDFTGKTVSGISVSGPARRMDNAKLDEIRLQLKHVCAEISLFMGYAE